MPLTLQVLTALIAGLAVRLGTSGADGALPSALLPVLEPAGSNFMNAAIRMTVIPSAIGSFFIPLAVGTIPDMLRTTTNVTG